jgi:hypothetical protein
MDLLRKIIKFLSRDVCLKKHLSLLYIFSVLANVEENVCLSAWHAYLEWAVLNGLLFYKCTVSGNMAFMVYVEDGTTFLKVSMCFFIYVRALYIHESEENLQSIYVL